MSEYSWRLAGVGYEYVSDHDATRLNDGEGRRVAGKQPSSAPVTVRRGSGSGMWGRMGAQRGRSGPVRGRLSQRAERTRRDRESEGLVVPAMPGKLGGGKVPCFRVRPKERRSEGAGDCREPSDPAEDPRTPEEALRQGEA